MGYIMPSPSTSYVDHQSIFQEFEAYPFSDDSDFRAGLPTVIGAIRGNKKTPSQIDEQISRAQWFYFSRLKGINIPWEAYAEYSRSSSNPINPSSSSSSSSSPSLSTTSTTRGGNPFSDLNTYAETRRMMLDNTGAEMGMKSLSVRDEEGMSFAMLCQLISDGRAGEVEGVKQIPDELNTLPPSRNALSPRSKPWETYTQPSPNPISNHYPPQQPMYALDPYSPYYTNTSTLASTPSSSHFSLDPSTTQSNGQYSMGIPIYGPPRAGGGYGEAKGMGRLDLQQTLVPAFEYDTPGPSPS